MLNSCELPVVSYLSVKAIQEMGAQKNKQTSNLKLFTNS